MQWLVIQAQRDVEQCALLRWVIVVAICYVVVCILKECGLLHSHLLLPYDNDIVYCHPYCALGKRMIIDLFHLSTEMMRKDPDEVFLLLVQKYDCVDHIHTRRLTNLYI